jgi:hypothetical protein
MEVAGKGIIAGVFAGAADGEAALGLFGRDLVGGVCGAGRGRAKVGSWTGLDS